MLAPFISYVRDQKDLRIARKQIFLDDVDFELSEPTAEFDMLFIRQLLSAKHRHNVVVEGAFDFSEGGIIDVAREIKIDFRAACRAAFLHRRCHWPAFTTF